MPLVPLVPEMATPLRAEVSTSLIPLTSALTKVPTAPTGAAASSVMADMAGAVTVSTGASLTAVMFSDMVAGLWLQSRPPLLVPPLSCTLKVNEIGPFAFKAGVKTNPELALTSALAAISWPTVTATPLRVNSPVPVGGSDSMRTFCNVLAVPRPPTSVASEKPKLDAGRNCAMSSVADTVEATANGASFTSTTGPTAAVCAVVLLKPALSM